MSWHFLERWLEKSSQHTTLIGKFWITFIVICRMVVIASLGDRVYADEQSEFRCNTAQLGCNNVCFNQFSPISHIRFWGFQLVSCSLPSIIFIIYSGHKTHISMEAEAEFKRQERLKKKEEKQNNNKQTLHSYITAIMESREKQALAAGLQQKIDSQEKRPIVVIPDKREGVLQTLPLKMSVMNVNSDKPFESKFKKITIDKLILEEKNKLNTPSELDYGNLVGGQRNKPFLAHKDSNFSDLMDRSDLESNLDGAIVEDRHFAVETEIQDNYNRDLMLMEDNDIAEYEDDPDLYNAHMDDQYDDINANENNNNNIVLNNNRKSSFFRIKKKRSRKVKRHSSANINFGVNNYSAPNSSANQNFSNNTANENTKNLSSLLAVESQSGKVKKFASQTAFVGDDTRRSILINDETAHITNNNFAAVATAASVKLRKSPSPQKEMPEMVVNPKFTDPGKTIIEKKKIMDKAVSRHFEIYLLSIFTRLFVEIFFAYQQATLYGFEVPGEYECTAFPCPNTVPCFISRPQEKTIFLILMHVFTGVSIFLNIAEIVFLTCLGCRKLTEAKLHLKNHLRGKECIRTKMGRRNLKTQQLATIAANRRKGRKRTILGNFVRGKSAFFKN